MHSRLLRELEFSSKHNITHISPTEATTRTQLSLPYPTEARTMQSLVLSFVLSFGLRSVQKHISHLLLFIIPGLICTCSVNFCNASQSTNKASEQVSAVRTVLTVGFFTSAHRTMFLNDEKKRKKLF